MKFLLADLANEGEIKILLVKKAGGLQILNAYYETFPPGSENLAELLAEKLRRENLLNIPLYLVLPGKMVKDSVLHLPQMPDRELGKVIPREIANLTSQKSPYVYGYRKGDLIQEKQSVKQELVLFYSEKEQIMNLLRDLRDQEIRPEKLLLPNEAMLALLPFLPFVPEEREALAFMEVKPQKLSITIMKGSVWSVNREFQYRSDPDRDPDDDDLNRIIMEASRTFQFFRQKNRSFALSRAMLYGSGLQPGIQNHLAENLGLGIQSWQQQLLAKLTLPASVTSPGEFLSIFITSIGALYLLQQKKVSNFLPEEFSEKEVLLKRVIGWVIASAVLLGIMLPAIFYLEGIKSENRDSLARLQNNFAAIDANVAEIESTKQQRARYYRNSFFLYFPRESGYRIAEFVRQLSLVVDPQVRLLELDMTNGYSKIRFSLGGEIRLADNVQSQKKFLEFFDRMQGLPGVARLSYSDLRTVTERETTAEQIEERGFSPLSFVIKGEIERQ